MRISDPTSIHMDSPASPLEFEELCLDLWKEKWSAPDAQRYGVSGQGQHGIDIYSGSRGGPCRVVQCKDYWRTKLTKKIIDSIVADVETSDLKPISELVIATTKSCDQAIQAYVLNLTRERKKKKQFKVVVYFWENICSLLREYPSVYKAFYGDYSDINVNLAGEVAIDKGLIMDEVLERLNKRNFQDALRFVDAFSEKQQNMDEKTKFRVLTNRGVILSRTGKYQEAAGLFLQAYSLNKNGDHAGTNAAQILLAIGNTDKAVEIANEVIAVNSENALAQKVLILASANLSEAQSRMNALPDSLKNASDVLFGMSMVAVRESRLEIAEKYLHSAYRHGGQKDALVCAQLGSVIYARMQNEKLISDVEVSYDHDKKLQTSLRKVQKLLSFAIEHSSDMADDILYQCYSNRAYARLWLGDIGGASKDAETCANAVPTSATYKKVLASVRCEQEDLGGAIKVLQSIKNYGDTPEALIMLADLLMATNDFNGALKATTHAIRLRAKPVFIGIRAKHLKTQLLIKLGRSAEAHSYVQKLIDTDPDNPLWRADMCSCLQSEGKSVNDPDLQSFLDKTTQLTTAAISPNIRDQIAAVLVSLSRYDLSIIIDRMGVSGRFYSPRTIRLLEGYMNAGHYQEAKNLCDALINAGAKNREFYWCRAHLHVRSRDLDAAEEDLKSCIALLNNDKTHDKQYTDALVFLTYTRLSNGHLSDALDSARQALGQSNIEPSQFNILINALISAREYDQALQMTYTRLLEPTNRSTAEAYAAFMNCVLIIGRMSPATITQGSTIGMNSAVLVKTESGDQVWYATDDAKRPTFGNLVFLPRDDKFWLDLVEKKVGDTVSIGDSGKTVVVSDVRNKYAVTCSECIALYQKQFPDRNDFQSIPVMSPDDETEISKQLRKQIVDVANYGAYVRKLIVAQRNGFIPLAYVARLLGKNLVELSQGVSENETVYSAIPGALPLNCNDAITTLVVDPITALTFSKLQVFEHGVPQRWSVVYTRSTLSALEEAVNELEMYSRSGEGSVVSLDGEHFSLVKTSREMMERQLSQVRHAIAWLHDHASLRPCDLILAYEDKRYQQGVKVIGNSEFEAVVMAQEPGQAFVSDELALRRVAMSEHATSISTQDVLRWALDGRFISQREYGLSLMQLYQSNIRGLYFDTATIIDLCESAQWDVNRLPLGLFAAMSADNIGNAGARIAGHVACEVYLKIQDKPARGLWWSLLINAVTAGGVPSVDALRAVLQSMKMDGRLHLVPQAEKELQGAMDAWLRMNIVHFS